MKIFSITILLTLFLSVSAHAYQALPPSQVLRGIANDPNIRGLQQSIPRLAGAYAQRRRQQGRQQRSIELARIIGDSSNPQAQIDAYNELAVINPQAARAIRFNPN